jgi:hypothetical protein
MGKTAIILSDLAQKRVFFIIQNVDFTISM